MKKNVGGIDRIARIAVGILLIVLAIVETFHWLAGIAGAIVLATGIFRFCSFYIPLGINTCPLESGSQDKK